MKVLFNIEFIVICISLIASIKLTAQSDIDCHKGHQQSAMPLGEAPAPLKNVYSSLLDYSCLALDASEKSYEFSSGILIDFQQKVLPTLWLDCDWIFDVLKPEIAKLATNGKSASHYEGGWWEDFISTCNGHVPPKGYKANKLYTGTEGTQVSLYTSLSNGPAILSFAGTQTIDNKDFISDMSFGLTQLKEFSELRSHYDSNEDWHFYNDYESNRKGNLNHKFRLKTGNDSETLVSFLADIVSDNKDIIITGHSLGGGLAQAASYLIQKRANERSSKLGTIHVYTWNGLGGQRALENYLKEKGNEYINQDIIDKIRIKNYALEGDIVSSIANHIGNDLTIIQNNSKKNPLISIYDTITNPFKNHRLATIANAYKTTKCVNDTIQK